MLTRTTLLASFALASAALVPAQVIQRISVGGSEVVFFDEMGGQEPVVVAPDAAKPADAAKAKPSARQEKLAKLDYDRRVSAILKAWSTPPKPPEEPKKDEAPKPPEPAAATPPAPAAPPADPNAAPADPNAPPPDPEAARKAAEAAEQARKQAEEAAAKAAETKAIEEEMVALKRNVTIGDWPAVQAYYAKLTHEESKAGFSKMLQSLQKGPQDRPQVPQQGQPFVEKNRFEASDVLGLVHVPSIELEKADLALIGQILRQALDSGVQLDVFVGLVRNDLGAPGFPLDKRKLARILAGANELVALGELLPTPEEAESSNDREGLNLLARHFLAQNDKERKVEWLERAWRATQAALAAGEVGEEEKAEALKRAVDIAPKIAKELGQKWLDES